MNLRIVLLIAQICVLPQSVSQCGLDLVSSSVPHDVVDDAELNHYLTEELEEMLVYGA